MQASHLYLEGVSCIFKGYLSSDGLVFSLILAGLPPNNRYCRWTDRVLNIWASK